MYGDSGENAAFGFGGSASSNNPFWNNFASDSAKALQQQNPDKIVQMGDNGSNYMYDNYTGASGNEKPIYGQTGWTKHDAAGQQVGAGVHKKDKWMDLVAIAGLAALGMGAFLPGMVGGAGASGGAGMGMAGDAFLPGALGAEGASMGALPGLEGYAAYGAAGDAFLPGALGGDAMMPGALNIGGSTGTGVAGLPGLESYVTGAATSPMMPNGGAGTSLSSTVTSAANSPAARVASTVAPFVQQPNQQGGLSQTDLAGIIGGIMDYRGNKGASDDMMNYIRDAQGRIDRLYAPGSAEWNSLWEAMSRKDAAAGRNSQYGSRSVDFLGKIADTKAKYHTDLATGFRGQAADAFKQDNLSSGAGLSGAIKAALKNPQNLSSIVDAVSNAGSAAGKSFDDFIGGLFG